MQNLIDDKLRVRKKNKSWLARKTGLSLSVISRISNGRRDPAIRTAQKIAVALDSPIEEVFIF